MIKPEDPIHRGAHVPEQKIEHCDRGHAFNDNNCAWNDHRIMAAADGDFADAAVTKQGSLLLLICLILAS